jgi:hypothetical protein
VPIERPPAVEEVIDELRARLTLVALRAQEDGEVARDRGPSATGLRLPTVLSNRLSHRTIDSDCVGPVVLAAAIALRQKREHGRESRSGGVPELL